MSINKLIQLAMESVAERAMEILVLAGIAAWGIGLATLELFLLPPFGTRFIFVVEGII
ncbi:hypothetical protein D3C78_1564850 [compost metagenome]